MKIGSKIKVVEKAKYSGQEMAWTEPNTGVAALEKATRFLHTSESPLRAFAAKRTCFSTEDILNSMIEVSTKEHRSKVGSGKVSRKKYCYILELPAGTEVETFGNDEIRFDLVEGMELTYIGYYEIIILDTPIETQPISPKHERFIRVASKYYLSY
jgi:hypothetical protein